MTRDEFRTVLIAEIKHHRPESASVAEQIVDHLLTLQAMQAPDAFDKFMESYRQSVRERVANGIL